MQIILPYSVVEQLEAEKAQKRRDAELLAASRVAMQSRVHYDEGTDTVAFERVQDVEGVLEANKALQNAGFKGQSKDGFARQIGNIPFVVLEKWKNEEGLDINNADDWKKIRARLASEEFRNLRSVDRI
jgi:hypothetical protein